MERALVLKERAKCIALRVPVESGSGQPRTGCAESVHRVLTFIPPSFSLKGGPSGWGLSFPKWYFLGYSRLLEKRIISALLLGKITAASKVITIKFVAYIIDRKTVTLDGMDQINNSYFRKPSSKKLTWKLHQRPRVQIRDEWHQTSLVRHPSCGNLTVSSLVRQELLELVQPRHAKKSNKQKHHLWQFSWSSRMTPMKPQRWNHLTETGNCFEKEKHYMSY